MMRDVFAHPHFETTCVHGGEQNTAYGAIVSPLCLSTTFAHSGPGEKNGSYDYSRAGNPTREALEHVLADLENANHAFAFSSGCAAFTTFLLTMQAGDHLLVGDDIYSGTSRLLTQIFLPFGIATSFVDMTNLDDVRAAVLPATRALWVETPSNPLLKVFDIAGLAAVAREKNLLLGVDNTFASPALQRPLELGADIVLHSTTKYLNGHSDVTGGALLTNQDDLASRLRLLQKATGAVPSPFDCYLAIRGIKTLAVRIERQCASALTLAVWLEGQEEVARVHYPGLPSHPGHALAKRQMTAPGAMISIELRGGIEAARSLLKTTKLFRCAISLGAVESLANHPASMTHANVTEHIRQARGINDGLVRLSIGLEHVDDLYADLRTAFKAMRLASRKTHLSSKQPR